VDTTQAGVVGVDRDQRMMVSSEEVDAGSKKAYAQMMAEAQKKGVLDKDAAMLKRVQDITKRLIPHTAVFRPDAVKWAWEVHVISIDEVNAWCMPGGKMAMYTGLIQKLNATDDEIAAVMGHEIGHALREHARERMSRQMGTQLGVGLIGALFGIGDLGQSIAGQVANVTLNLPNSRLHETESDRIGVELAARAGFDPRGGPLGENGQGLGRRPAAEVALDAPLARGPHRRPEGVLGEGDAALHRCERQRSSRQVI
jgi:Zn-dependent protease with chaperone function